MQHRVVNIFIAPAMTSPISDRKLIFIKFVTIFFVFIFQVFWYVGGGIDYC